MVSEEKHRIVIEVEIEFSAPFSPHAVRDQLEKCINSLSNMRFVEVRAQMSPDPFALSLWNPEDFEELGPTLLR